MYVLSKLLSSKINLLQVCIWKFFHEVSVRGELQPDNFMRCTGGDFQLVTRNGHFSPKKRTIEVNMFEDSTEELGSVNICSPGPMKKQNSKLTCFS
ncbi:hypothetical protein F0562_002147 [Nyssa sinensis]|uniref:Uncharacterized protein n=1 Tax=Nyssa sinensis TaxID=561372 RepID=A0A5J5C4Y7_9ASTE|nr:hypothetical protein F0562_002147 [Nyssa sinensis]